VILIGWTWNTDNLGRIGVILIGKHWVTVCALRFVKLIGWHRGTDCALSVCVILVGWPWNTDILGRVDMILLGRHWFT
jgi:hypothetical protein